MPIHAFKGHPVVLDWKPLALIEAYDKKLFFFVF